MISGGGTGGHIYPAIAIADELKARHPHASFLFVGSSHRMEMQRVPAAGYPIAGLWISGIQRKWTLRNFLFPLKLLISLWKCRKLLRAFQPDLVVGTGGFASGPLLYQASRKKIPTLIQEQNSYPGITNKLLAKRALKICVAYDNLEVFFPATKIHKTGNPIREDLLSLSDKKEEAASFYGLDPKKKTLLLVGGSLGAKNLNLMMEDSLDWLVEREVQVIWQTGSVYFEKYQKHRQKKGVRVLDFVHEMNFAYAAADFIVSRAGAGAISELCLVGKPTIFVPSPNVAEDHQTKNARAIVEKNAAILLPENQRSHFQMHFERLLEDEDLQEVLSHNIKKLALPNATKDIVDVIEGLIKHSQKP